MHVMLSIKANKTESQEQGHLVMQARGEAHLKLAQTIMRSLGLLFVSLSTLLVLKVILESKKTMEELLSGNVLLPVAIVSSLLAVFSSVLADKYQRKGERLIYAAQCMEEKRQIEMEIEKLRAVEAYHNKSSGGPSTTEGSQVPAG